MAGNDWMIRVSDLADPNSEISVAIAQAVAEAVQAALSSTSTPES